ncbi:MAG: hypothetical protein APR54_08005 [Candidatus Cloacimonas sp. SDB]|nr:MAG: hypothetical protein APR54_08005 [Candidatus Cloacimonas sp. SDB]
MEKRNEYDILDLILILAKRRKIISIVLLVTSIIIVSVSFIIPEKWTSTCKIKPSNAESNNLQMTSALFGDFGSSFLGGNTDCFELISYMRTTDFSEDVIEKFNLITYFDIKDNDSLIIKEKAYNFLNEKLVKFFYNDETSEISIIVTTTDQFLSAKIANYYGFNIDFYNKQNRMTKGKEKRIFIESRTDEVRSKIDSLSNKLKEFQKTNNVIDINTQLTEYITYYSKLVSSKMEAEIELEIMSKRFDEPTFNQLNLKDKITSIDKKLLDLETGFSNEYPRYIVPIDSFPDLMMEYANLKIDLETQEKVYEFLYPQLESARIEELKDLPTIDIIQEAYPAGLRSSPKRARMCILVFLSSFIICSLLILFKELISEEKKVKFKKIIKLLNPFLKK